MARGLGEPKIYSLQRRHTHVINFYFRFSQQGAPPVSSGRCKSSLSSSRTIIIGLHGVRLGSAWLGLGFDWARSPRTLHIAACIKLNVRAASHKLLCLLRSGRVSVCVRVCVDLSGPAWPGLAFLTSASSGLQSFTVSSGRQLLNDNGAWRAKGTARPDWGIAGAACGS